jgi:hypothetical protein
VTRSAPTLILRVAPEWGFRRFLDSEPSTSNKSYNASGIVAVGASVEFYPFSTASAGAMRDFGLTGSYVRAIGLTSRDVDTKDPATGQPTEVDTEWYHYAAGIKLRLLGRSSRFALGFAAGYEQWVFDFPGAPPTRYVPTARYGLVPGGFDARLSLGVISFLADARYLHPLSIANIGDREPSSPRFGLRGGLGMAVTLSQAFAIDLSGEYTMFTFSLPSVAGRGDQPGKVLDQYLVGSLGFTLSL